jgi:hypothetical protein
MARQSGVDSLAVGLYAKQVNLDSAMAVVRTVGEKLPQEVRACILCDPNAPIGELLTILDDDELAFDCAPDGGWAPIHAVELLTALKATQAIELMLDVLGRCDEDEILQSRIAVRLPEFGAFVLEPALARLQSWVDPDKRRVLCHVLANLGVRDERIYQALCQLFDAPHEEVHAAFCFAAYADKRALALLEGAISDFEPDPERATGLMDLEILVESYESFGEALPTALQQHVAALKHQWQGQRSALTDAQASFVNTTTPPDRRRASAVVVVDTTESDCDIKAAEHLITFAAPEVKALGRRRSVEAVQQTLLWCAFAWNHALEPNATEILDRIQKNHGDEHHAWLAQLFERRRRECLHPDTKIGPLRTTRMPSGAVRLHVDRDDER